MIRFLLLLSLSVSASISLANDGLAASKKGVAAVNHDLYRANCAECHFAYQPGLLPSRSWQALMKPLALENHYGDNAELDDGDRLNILAYLMDNSADNSEFKRSRKMMRSIGDNETPLRITEVRYFKRKHNEIPSRMVIDNPKVKSWSNCLSCHTGAERGSYREREVRIPGYPGWED